MPSDYMLTAEELRQKRARRRHLVLVLLLVAVLGVATYFGARPVRNGIKGWQARRHAVKAMRFVAEEQWNDARAEAIAAYQLRSNEPAALRAVAQFLSRTRQPQALEFWDQLAKLQPLTRDDLRDEAAIALMAGELGRAGRAVDSLLAAKDPAPADFLLAAQADLQHGDREKAEANLSKILDAPHATEREQFQAAILQLALAEGAKDEAKETAAHTRLSALSQLPTQTGLDALVVLTQRALAQSKPEPPATDSAAEFPSDLVHSLQSHPLARAPQKLLALDLIAHEDSAQREAMIARGIAEWENGDPAALAALATWLNGKGEHQAVLDHIPLGKALQARDVFLQYVDALGALGRWREIQ